MKCNFEDHVACVTHPSISPPCPPSAPGQNEFVVETSLVGTVLNGLSHLSSVAQRGQFMVGLLRGLGGNLPLKTRQEFAKEVRHIPSL